MTRSHSFSISEHHPPGTHLLRRRAHANIVARMKRPTLETPRAHPAEAVAQDEQADARVDRQTVRQDGASAYQRDSGGGQQKSGAPKLQSVQRRIAPPQPHLQRTQGRRQQYRDD